MPWPSSAHQSIRATFYCTGASSICITHSLWNPKILVLLTVDVVGHLPLIQAGLKLNNGCLITEMAGEKEGLRKWKSSAFKSEVALNKCCMKCKSRPPLNIFTLHPDRSPAFLPALPSHSYSPYPPIFSPPRMGRTPWVSPHPGITSHFRTWHIHSH